MKKAKIHPAIVAAKTLKKPPKSCGVLWREARKLAAATPPHCGVVAEDRNSFPPLAAARYISHCLQTVYFAATRRIFPAYRNGGKTSSFSIKTRAIAAPCADMSQVCVLIPRLGATSGQ